MHALITESVTKEAGKTAQVACITWRRVNGSLRCMYSHPDYT